MLKKYRTILEQAEAEIVEKKSRFIATVRPVKTEDEELTMFKELDNEESKPEETVEKSKDEVLV